MKVSMLGFEVKLSKEVSVGEFFQQLSLLEDKEIGLRSRKVVLYVDGVDRLISGLVLMYKENKKSLISTRDPAGDLLVTKSILDPNQHGSEVSIFLLNPRTMKGIFFSYSGAVSPLGLADLFKKCNGAVVRYKRAEYKKQLTDFGKKKVSDIGAKLVLKYPGDFSFGLLVTPSDLNKILPRYKEISSVHLRAANALSEGGRYTPLDDVTKRAHVSVDFDPRASVSVVRQKVKDVFGIFANSSKSAALRVIGKAYSGEELSLFVGENTDSFGAMEYDDFVELLPKRKWKDYVDSDALKKLLSAMRGADVIFGEPPPDWGWKLVGAKPVVEMSGSGLITKEA